MHAKLLQSCPTPCDSIDHSSPGSSVHGILQARIPGGLPCPPPGDHPNPGIEPESIMSPELTGRFFTTSTTWEMHYFKRFSEFLNVIILYFILYLYLDCFVIKNNS